MKIDIFPFTAFSPCSRNLTPLNVYNFYKLETGAFTQTREMVTCVQPPWLMLSRSERKVVGSIPPMVGGIEEASD